MFLNKYLLRAVLFLFVCSTSLFSAEADKLSQLYKQLHFPVVNLDISYDVSSDTIFHHDFALVLDSGRIAFFKPVLINSDSVVFGAYFQGKGRMNFHPSIQMERDQLKRFFNSDSLNEEIENAIIFFSPAIYDSIKVNLSLSEENFTSSVEKKTEKLHNSIKVGADFLFTFELMRNLTSPIGKPYLISSFQTKQNNKLIYMYNSYLREEIRLWKHSWQPGNSYMELVNSYSQYNTDESYHNINGRNKKQIDIIHYDINTSIDHKGVLTSQAKVQAKVLAGPFQLIQFSILPTLAIDSIIDKAGKIVQFQRAKLDVTFRDWESNQFVLFLNEDQIYGDILSLTFYYNGEIAQYDFGELYLFAGASWYPRYGFRDKATFDLTYKTDKRYTFTSCGHLQDEKTIGDTLITKWSVKPEAANVSFNLGYMKKYTFKEDDIVPVNVFYSKELHNDIGNYLSGQLVGIGKDMEKQVSEDVMNAMRVFNHYFGTYNLPSISVSEILASHSEAFPGFVHLGFNTWINTDAWGNDRLLRAHEVAHQWWGVGVGYETYHDQWLSEGFAEYSALMYYQVLTDNKKFLKKLKESRNNIFSARKYLFFSGEESGPIAMGYRTSSSKTSGDYGLIIYEKGAFVLHMLRNMMIDLKTMNEDNFLQMLREFYETYRGKDASTQDFKRIAEKYVGIKLDWFFDQWVYHNYLPEYKFSYDIVHNDSTKLLDVKCTIITKGVPDDFKMYIPLEIQFDKKNKAYLRLLVDSNEYSFDIPGLSKRPKKLILNPFESVLAKVKQ